MSLQSEIYNINKENNFSSSCIVRFNTLTPDKFFITAQSHLELPRIIDFNINNSKSKKACHYHKDFSNSNYIYFRNYDIDKNLKFLIPLFQCSLFKCSSCNKIHNAKSNQCCDLINSPIEIVKAKLIKITIPDNENVHQSIEDNRKEFLKLHFPDLTDMIIMR